MYAMISNNSTVTVLKKLFPWKHQNIFLYDHDFTVDYVITNTPKVVKA
jgi:hypothetical protein